MMKKLKIIIPSLIIICLAISFSLYNMDNTTTAYSILKQNVSFCVPYPSSEPMLYLTNKAIVCHYLGYNNITGGASSDCFDLSYIANQLRPVEPTGNFSFHIIWDGAQMKFDIRQVSDANLARYMRNILENMQRIGFSTNASFRANITMNYKSKYVKIFIENFESFSPKNDGTVEMRDILPINNYELIPYLPKNVSSNYQGLPPEVQNVMNLVSP